MENKIIKKCNINSDTKIITIELNNGEILNINVGYEKNDDIILNLIDEANRQYVAILYQIGETYRYSSYGCLTSKVVGLNNIPITFLNPKYIINVFIKICQCIFQDDLYYLNYCTRDEDLNIPSSEEELSSLVKKLMTIYNNNEKEIDNDDQLIDIKDIFMILLEYIGKLQSNKKLNNINFNKTFSIMGGVSNLESLQDSLKDNFNETLLQTGENIHKLMYTYKNDIYENEICKNDINNIKNFIDTNPNVHLYNNIKISFKEMINIIGNIFRVLFLNILPQKSMLDCLYATLYQAAFLNELNILEYHSKEIQLPIMFRLIHSFFKDENKQNELKYENEKISKLVDKLCKTDKKIETLCDIAVKINFQNLEELNSVYWILNEKRGFTYEFYIVILIYIYTLSKCKGMNKDNTKLNAKIFGEPIYNLLYKFHDYVVNHLKYKHVALCTTTLDNFNTIYRSEINKCLKNLLKTIHK